MHSLESMLLLYTTTLFVGLVSLPTANRILCFISLLLCQDKWKSNTCLPAFTYLQLIAYHI
jgi:hypothetical protein